MVSSAAPGARLEPAREALVQLGAPLLGQAPVGRLADQRVREAERVLARRARSGRRGSAACARARRARRGAAALVPGQQLRQRAGVEAAALDRGVLEQRALAGSRRSMRAASTAWMRRRQRGVAASAPTATSCSRNSGLPSAGLHDAAPSAPGRRRRRARRAGAPRRPTARRARAATRSGCGAAQAGRDSTSSGRARQTSRIGVPARERDEVVEQVEQRRLRPVDVLDDHDERALARRRARAACAPPRTSPRPGPRRRPGRSRQHQPRDVVAVEQLGDALRGSPPSCVDDLGERPVGRRRRRRRGSAPTDHGRVAAERGRSSSRASRDLPIPAGPTTVTARQPLLGARRRRTRRAARRARARARRTGSRARPG